MSAGDPPTGVVTFLFTDIEGSTRRWEADADEMRSALGHHPRSTIVTGEAELRDGDKSYESLVLRGAEMTMSEMATFTYQEIDDVRTELERSP